MGPEMELIQEGLWDEVKPVDNSKQSAWAAIANVENFPHPRVTEIGKPDHCWGCKSAVWVLWIRLGFKVYMDPEPVTPAQDLEFYLAKPRRKTFALWKVGNEFEADYRGNHDIKRDDGSHIVLAEHKCDPNNIRTELPNYYPRPSSHYSEEPPF